MRRVIPPMLLVQVVLLFVVLRGLWDLLGDIGGFFSGVFNDVTGVVSAVWDAIKAIFKATEDVFSAVLDAWEWCWNGLVWFATQAENAVSSVIDGIGWFVYTAIPDAVEWAARFAFTEVEAAVDELTTLVKDVVQAAINAVLTVVHAIEDALTAAIHVVTGVVNEIVHFIDTVVNHVVDLVLHPEKLIEWVWSAIVAKLLGELWALVRVIVRFVWDEIRSDVRGFAHTIEDIADVLL